jgi:hypothetical protein
MLALTGVWCWYAGYSETGKDAQSHAGGDPTITPAGGQPIVQGEGCKCCKYHCTPTILSWGGGGKMGEGGGYCYYWFCIQVKAIHNWSDRSGAKVPFEGLKFLRGLNLGCLVWFGAMLGQDRSGASD